MRTVELTEDEAKDTAYLGLLTAKKVFMSWVDIMREHVCSTVPLRVAGMM